MRAGSAAAAAIVAISTLSIAFSSTQSQYLARIQAEAMHRSENLVVSSETKTPTPPEPSPEPDLGAAPDSEAPKPEAPKPEAPEPKTTPSIANASKDAAARADSSQASPAQPKDQLAIPAATKLRIDSDPISYKYGVIQIAMTEVDGVIIAIDLLQGDTGFGKDKAYQALETAALEAQGTSFGNYSGATFTTDAYRSAVANAMAKF